MLKILKKEFLRFDEYNKYFIPDSAIEKKDYFYIKILMRSNRKI